MVSALTATPGVFFDSAPDSGYSVDNLAPGVPQSITAAYQTSSVVLDWDDAPEIDFQFFRVYRSASAGFVPGPGNLVHETSTAGWTDTSVGAASQYYKISAVDFTGNESLAGEVAVVSDVPGAGAARFALHNAAPNPFNPMTQLSYSLATDQKVQLVIYDVSGREVITLVDELQTSGAHTVQWNGMDRHGKQAASGVYLYQLQAGSQIERKRMVLLK